MNLRFATAIRLVTPAILLSIFLAAAAVLAQDSPDTADTATPPDPAQASTDEPTMQLTESQRQWLAEHPVIRLGPYADYAPGEFIDENDKHSGIAADYRAIIEQKLGVRFTEVRSDTWQDILNKARDREIDLLTLIAENEERKAYLQFTRPYLKLPAVLLAREGVDQQLTPEDLVDMRVCVAQGYAVQDFFKKNYPQIILIPVPGTKEGILDVHDGTVDVFITDLAVASHFIEELGVANLRVVGETGYVYSMGFGVRHDWPELVELLDLALAEITPEERREIYNRWISISHETEFASQRMLTILIAIAIIIAAAAIGVMVWNRSLQRRVNEKTIALNEELLERQRVADALQTSEERVRLIISTALDAVITMDEHGRVTGWSKQAVDMFGWTRAEVIDQALANFIIPPQHRDAHYEGLERYQQTGQGNVLNTRIEITALRKDGVEFPIELSIAPIPKQESFEFAAFLSDITQRKEAEAELDKHREKLEELVVERTAELRAAKDAAETALKEVKQLRGLLPICSYCKRIREGEDYSRSVEAYLADHSDATFSHGVCPDCYKKHVEPELEQL